MSTRNAGRADIGLKLTAVLAVAIFVLAAGSVMIGNESAEADPAYRHSITYYPNGAGGEAVTASYDGIAATEYNPLYWGGSFNNSAGTLVNTNWTAPTGSTNYNSRAYNGIPKVFAGWSTIADYTSNSAVIYEPGDVVPPEIHELYAAWAFPQASIQTTSDTTGTVTGSDTSNVVEIRVLENTTVRLTLNFNNVGNSSIYTNTCHVVFSGSITGDYEVEGSRSGNYFNRQYNATLSIQNISTGEAGGVTDVVLKYNGTQCGGIIRILTVSAVSTYAEKGATLVPSNNTFSNSVSQMYTKQYYISGNLTGNLPAGSYRSLSAYTGSGGLSTVTITGNATCTGDVIIDNVNLASNSVGTNHGYGTTVGLYGNSHKLILGTGITNPTITDPLRAPVVYGGGTGDSTATVVNGKHIVSRADGFDSLSVNLGSFVIIHSGTYNSVMAGGRNNMGAANNPLSTYLVFKKATVIDTVGGGNATNGGTSYIIHGSSTYTTQFNPYQGGTFIYAIGLVTLSDMWAAQETGYSDYNSVTTNEGCNIQGGCSTGQVHGSTHVFVSGSSSLWDVQGGGRAGNAFCTYTYVEISGKAEIRHAACGSVTDGVTNPTTCTNGTQIVVRDNPTIAMLFGAGYDTWTNPTSSNMANGKTITVDIDGGTIGFVYGGGYRGTIGSKNNSIDVSVSITGGTVVYDVFGGGRGGVDKILRLPNGKGNGGSGVTNSTGCSIVYGDIDVLIGGDAVILGNVYGGGESVPLISRYYGSSFGNNDEDVNVAMVTGNTSVTICDNASVAGNVYGAGKGINLSGNSVVGTYTPVTGDEVADYYTKNITVSRSYVSGDYAIQQEGGVVSLAFHFLDWYNHSRESGSITYDNSSAVLDRYLEYAMTEKNGTVVVNDNATVGKSVYGGGAFSRVSLDTSVTINSDNPDTAIGEDVFGGGLGRAGKLSVGQDSSVTITKGTIGRDVYGGSAYGIVTRNSTVTIDSGTIGRDVYGGGLGEPDEESVNGDTEVIMNNGTVNGSIFGGSAYGIVAGDVRVTVVSGSIGGSVYGGGLGRSEHISTKGKRYVYIQGGTITDSVFGGSSVGDDHGNALTSDALVVVSQGTIGQSVYGGGFMGNTYGSTAVYIGYTYDGVGNPQPNTGAGENPVITLGGSVYAGGDVGESLDTFTVPLVHGDGKVYIHGLHTDITIPGSIMASGNSCLTAGATSIELWYFDDPVQMFGVHRADTVLLFASHLDVLGMYSKIGNGASSVEKMCSLSHIGVLTMQAESSVYIANPIEDVAQYRSLTREDTPTTVSAPFNKIVFTAGSTLFIRSNTGTNIDYGSVLGYTVLSVADNAPFGGYVLGDSVTSAGGFVILKDGSYNIADYADYTNDVRCWFIAGVESKVLTLSLPYGAGQQQVSGSIDIIKLQESSNLTYTGGTFIPYNDGYSFARPGEGAGNSFGLMFGYMNGDSTTTLVSDKAHVIDLNGSSSSSKYSTFYLGDDSSSQGVDLFPAVLRTGTVSGTSSASPTPMNATFTPDENGRAGTFTLNMLFCGSPNDKTDYIGYVIIYIQEINRITYTDDEGEHTENMVSNRIELHIDLYTVGSELHPSNDLTLNTVGGTGDVSFLFNTGMRNYSVYILSSERSNDESGVELTVQGVRNVGNNTGWKDTDPAFSIGDFNPGQDLDNLKEIGTLNGGFMATARFSVTGFDPEYNGMTFTITLVLKDGDGNWVMQGGNVKKVLLNITIRERDPIVVTFYDYEQGITIDTGGTEVLFGYGTVLTEAQCPPVLENFIGWYTEETFVNIYSFNTPLVKNISLFARYTYTVTFDYQNGTTSQVYVASTADGVRISAPTDPARVGYHFEGWYKQSACIEQWDFSRDRVTGNVTLYAKWVGEDVRVLFKDAHGNTLDYRITANGSSLVDPSVTGDLTGPFVRYGENFNVIDIFYSTSVSMDVNILDGAKTLLNSDEIFIKWTSTAVNGRTVAIYADTVLNDTLIDIQNAPIVDGMKVIYLSAVTSKIAVLVKMEALTTDLNDIIGEDEVLREHLVGKVNTTDLSASVTAPAQFLIYPEEDDLENLTVFTFPFTLNDATRSGWTLYGWHNTHVSGDLATYPAAGLSKTVRLITEKIGDNIYVVHEQMMIDNEWETLISYDTYTTANRLDNPAAPYTIRYIALWEQIEYTVTISNTAHGIVDAYYIDSQTGTQTPGTTFRLHYGDRIKLVFTPDERYDFYRWTYYGECDIEDPDSAVTTLVVTGDAIIYASDTGERVVRLYATFDGTDTAAPASMYLRDSETGEYLEIPKNATSDQVNNALYRAYIVTGTYFVCILDGDDVYVFGTAVIGTGETTYHYNIFTVNLDIKDDEDHAVDVGSGITSYTKYVGKEAGSDDLLYGSITVSEGYTYDLRQGYIEEDTGQYNQANNLGNDAVGVMQETVLNYRLTSGVSNPRIIWGQISPITFTVTFIVGSRPGDTSWIDPSDSDITTPATLASVTVKYGETFEGKLPSAADISYHDSVLGTDGHLDGRNYAVYNWYLRYSGSSFDDAVYQTTVINAAFISEFVVGEINNNSFSLYSWIIKNVDEITITYVVEKQQADDGTAYDTSPMYDVIFISLNANTYTGIFALPSFTGFKTYLEMGYTGPTDLGDWMTITATYAPGQSGTYTSSIVVTETDVKASFVFTGDKPTIALDLKYDRLTALVYIDLGEYGELGEGAEAYLLSKGWTTVEAGKIYSCEARYKQTLYAPWLELKDEYSEYYALNGWTMVGGTGLINSDVPVPGTGKTTYSYQVTLDDVQAHRATPSAKITFSAAYEAISLFALTFITPIGTFSNGYQRRTVYLTPAQNTADFIEIPTYDANYYDWLGWNVQPPQHLTHDQEVVGTWYVRQHTLTFTVDEGSTQYINVSANHDQYTASSGSSYNHHSEIIVTIAPAPGYTLDLANTLSHSTGTTGEPVFISDDRGYRWTFFLDENASIRVYAMKATIPVHFLVNGNLWVTENLEKYDYLYFDDYSEVGYSASNGWYLTSNYTGNPYSTRITDPQDPNYGRYYIQVISETFFYTEATPNTYFIIFHPNNETETEAFDTDASAAISAYLNNGTALPSHIQAVTYGEGFRLNDQTYSWTDCLMEGWVRLTAPYDSAPADRMLSGRMTYLMQQTISEDMTLANYDGQKSLYDDENGVIHMYAYYVAFDIPEATYDGQGHSGSIVKKTYTADQQNFTVYYSASILNSANYSTVGSTTPVAFTDAGNHVAFYYGWVSLPDDDSKKSVFQGTFTVAIEKRTVVFTSGSASRGFIEGTPLTNETVTYGTGIVAGEQDGLTFTFTYEDSSGVAPVAQGVYDNTFTVTFDGVRIKSTNYDWSQVIGTLTITASADNIKVERTVNKVYGDGTYTLVWTDEGKPSCQKDNVNYTSADTSVVTVSSGGTLTILAAGNTSIHVAMKDNANVFVDVQVIIAKKGLDFTITLSSTTKMYDNTATLPSTPTVTAVSGIVAEDEGLVTYTITGRYSSTHAGNSVPLEFTVTISGTKGDNYTTGTVTKPSTGIITQRSIVINTESASKVFDNTELTAGYTLTGDGFVTGQGFSSVNVTGTITDVGSTPNTLSAYVFNAGTTTPGDYNVSSNIGTLTVTVRTVTIPTGGSYEYTGETISAAIATSPYYILSGDTSGKDKATYTAYADLRYNDRGTVNVKWSDDTTTQKTILWYIVAATLKWNYFSFQSETHYYDGEAYMPALIYIGPDDARRYVVGVDYSLTYVNNVNATVSEGSTYLLVTGLGGYAGSNHTYTFVISPRGVNITVDAYQSYEYDHTEKTLAYVVDTPSAGSGFLPGHAEQVSVTNGAETDAGTYNSVFSVTGGIPTNYRLYLNGSDIDNVTWTITKKPVYVVCDAVSFMYDGTEHDVVTSSSGLVDGDDAALACTNNLATHSGEYVASFSITGTSSSNYLLYVNDVSITSIAWEVSVRPIYIITASAWKAFDGTALTESGYSSFGILPSEAQYFVITIGGTQTDVGFSTNTVTCTLSGDLNEDDYDITLITGTLVVIAPQSATVTMNMASPGPTGAPAAMAVVSPNTRRLIL